MKRQITSGTFTVIRGTRIQMKIGTYIDTFLATNVLTEVKDQMPGAQSQQRVIVAEVSPPIGFTPKTGECFEVLAYQARSGNFAQIKDGFQPSYGAQSLTLTAE
jgi:hypothetical protein